MVGAGTGQSERRSCYRVGESILELLLGDITQQRVDAIVNAANEQLRGGAGVDGAIHRAGGPAIMAECRQFDGCPTGQAVVTGGGNLPCRFVIHTVGPIWGGGGHSEAALLASAYRESLARAREIGVDSLAFPALSTGAYGYPVEAAARIALATVRDGLEEGGPALVRFVLFGEPAYEAFEAAADEVIRVAG